MIEPTILTIKINQEIAQELRRLSLYNNRNGNVSKTVRELLKYAINHEIEIEDMLNDLDNKNKE